jgi:hypothetical protein
MDLTELILLKKSLGILAKKTVNTSKRIYGFTVWRKLLPIVEERF